MCGCVLQGVNVGQRRILYSLYGVVEHSGRLNAGHYTAYIKVRANVGHLTNFLNKHNVSVREYLTKYAERVRRGDRQEVENPGDGTTLLWHLVMLVSEYYVILLRYLDE